MEQVKPTYEQLEMQLWNTEVAMLQNMMIAAQYKLAETQEKIAQRNAEWQRQAAPSTPSQ
ncbi:MAG: hypothetical protein ACREO5_00115 [Candidatus Binatia bacterium]